VGISVRGVRALIRSATRRDRDGLLFIPPPPNPSPTQNAMAATFDSEYRKMLSTPVLSVTTVPTSLA